ncbi:coiled-coil domain-containing protein [Thermococcus thioreducens]|uniref:Uncharacterized protein n=1 Tax=Thermococcus thioreducens TaxID=277988 RepID=A0A0Q2MQM4_9EURY|nr:hypothetical protein [Thermococcus thioreducens]ASJ11724.1 hypothetical protein A3L14_01950 [Thermococcus thioreducens]KQH81983.1 hypothetical protein AMR53_08590 [Thermococcus thioreducens]SEW14950.1 hypothetical protein SAMN05216170_1892 [Thermococcus thioreducens]
MKLEQALEEYERRKRKAEKEVEKIRKKYNTRLEKRIREVLKRIDALEKKEVPKKVDENIKKIVTAEKRNYVTALRNVLSSISDMDDLGKRLPDLAKLHVGHGKYLLIIFEKDVYAINRLLKELNEDYVSYYNELSKKGLPDLRLREILWEEEKTREHIQGIEREKLELEREVKAKEEELKGLYSRQGLQELEEAIKSLSSSLRSAEMEIRSKASKLQKPIKRMRLHEPIAGELIKDSSVALRKPDEFVSLLQRIYPRLEGKYKKTAQWLIENLREKSEVIRQERERLSELEKKRDEILASGESKKKEIWELHRLIEEKEAEIRKLRRQLEHLERELKDSLAKLEEILGQKVER